MSLSIRLNPNQEELLLKKSREYIHSLNTSYKKNVVLPVFPAVIFVESEVLSRKTMEELKKGTERLCLSQIEICGNEVVCAVRIDFSGTRDIAEKIILGRCTAHVDAKPVPLCIPCRSFRFATAERNGNSITFSNFTWCKTKA